MAGGRRASGRRSDAPRRNEEVPDGCLDLPAKRKAPLATEHHAAALAAGCSEIMGMVSAIEGV